MNDIILKISYIQCLIVIFKKYIYKIYFINYTKNYFTI